MGSRPPSYKLTFEQRPQYLFAHVQADSIDEQGIIAYLTEVADKCDEIDCEKVLVVRDIATTRGIGEQHATTTDFVKRMTLRQAAFVNPYPAVDEEMKFAIMVATNRSANFRLFRDVESAEKWLLNG